MRWPWTRFPKQTGGEEARVEAESSLAETREPWPEVTRVAQSLRDLRERNHFAEQIESIFQGGRR